MKSFNDQIQNLHDYSIQYEDIPQNFETIKSI